MLVANLRQILAFAIMLMAIGMALSHEGFEGGAVNGPRTKNDLHSRDQI
jgi:hypothetical protein